MFKGLYAFTSNIGLYDLIWKPDIVFIRLNMFMDQNLVFVLL